MAKSPAFQMYPKDWLSDHRVKRLSWAAKGYYAELLMLMWAEGTDSLPDDDAQIAKILGVRLSQWGAIKSQIMYPTDPMFLAENGRLVSERLRAERLKQQESRTKRQNAAAKRWGKQSICNADAKQCTASSTASATALTPSISPSLNEASDPDDARYGGPVLPQFNDGRDLTPQGRRAWELLEPLREKAEAFPPPGDKHLNRLGAETEPAALEKMTVGDLNEAARDYQKRYGKDTTAKWGIGYLISILNRNWTISREQDKKQEARDAAKNKLAVDLASKQKSEDEYKRMKREWKKLSVSEQLGVMENYKREYNFKTAPESVVIQWWWNKQQGE
ncbi:hypothetical protein LCGC14_0298050 [marine sediment metagenome]|uniref:DUF1376 domain-containing protein n=1 Tax=marine sediment metagenome TaxID=412755 RepID=A0A0F9WCK8_9ZZZZ